MKKNEYLGKLIVFEGLDGSGSSTHAKRLQAYLDGWPFNVILTKEPTPDSDAGKLAREILQGKKEGSPWDLQRLFAKDREYHLQKVIIPWLQDGGIVISDRYFLSSLAFGTSDGVDLDALIDLNENKLIPELIEPDLTIFLRVAPAIAISRIEARGGEKERFEKQEKLQIVLSHYKRLIDHRYAGIYTINGERSVEEVSRDIKNIFLDLLMDGWIRTLKQK